jgi:hypothetical protein
MAAATGNNPQTSPIVEAQNAANRYGSITGAAQAGKSVEQQRKEMEELEEARRKGVESLGETESGAESIKTDPGIPGSYTPKYVNPSEQQQVEPPKLPQTGNGWWDYMQKTKGGKPGAVLSMIGGGMQGLGAATQALAHGATHGKTPAPQAGPTGDPFGLQGYGAQAQKDMEGQRELNTKAGELNMQETVNLNSHNRELQKLGVNHEQLKELQAIANRHGYNIAKMQQEMTTALLEKKFTQDAIKGIMGFIAQLITGGGNGGGLSSDINAKTQIKPTSNASPVKSYVQGGYADRPGMSTKGEYVIPKEEPGAVLSARAREQAQWERYVESGKKLKESMEALYQAYYNYTGKVWPRRKPAVKTEEAPQPEPKKGYHFGRLAKEIIHFGKDGPNVKAYLAKVAAQKEAERIRKEEYDKLPWFRKRLAKVPISFGARAKARFEAERAAKAAAAAQAPVHTWAQERKV